MQLKARKNKFQHQKAKAAGITPAAVTLIINLLI